MEDDQRPVPPLTDELRQAARENPGGWLYAVDPGVDPDGDVPPYAVIGAWQVDERGEVSEEFRHNPDYRASPRALGLDPPTDPVEAALQRCATGYGQEEGLAVSLLEAELILYAREEGGLYAVENAEGRKTIQVYTAPEHRPSEWTSWQTVRGRALAALGSGYDLQVNPGAQVSVRVPVEDLAAVLAEWDPAMPPGGAGRP
ncbi:MAG TPA: type VII secretion system-associated protein [Pseudonocardia sp.]|jgi:hypothetical protein|nr:type VII secretion system-associated protein [Pseudonocardia sp.]